MKQQFRSNLGLRSANIEKLQKVNSIIEEFSSQGYKLTLRQIYYQLVSRDIILNCENEYAKLGSLLVKGRMAGVIDWEIIEDRIRKPYRPYWVVDIPDAIDDIIQQYRLDRQENQDVYIELMVEKDALSGILKKITSYYHIYLSVNRGYCSCIALYKIAQRLKIAENQDKETWILYIGDHDPSGLDMLRDLKDRLEEFDAYPEIEHLGLTFEQIQDFNPPPNPTKITDPRAKWYIEEFGNESWEVDALSPEILNNLVKINIEQLVDLPLFEEMITQEEKDKKELKKFRDNYIGKE